MLFPVVNSVETIFLLKHCYEEFLSIYYLLHSIQEYLFAFSKPLQIGPLHYNNLVFLYTYRHLYRLRQIEIFVIITAAIHIHVLVQTLADFPYTDVPFYTPPPFSHTVLGLRFEGLHSCANIAAAAQSGIYLS
jgi:hypothetical protein